MDTEPGIDEVEVVQESEPLSELVGTSEPVSVLVEESEPLSELVGTSEPVSVLVDESEPLSELMEESEPLSEIMEESEVMEEDETIEGDVMEETSEHSEEPTENDIVQVQSDEDEDSENIAEYPVPQFPVARVRKIMQYGMAAEDDEDDHEVTSAKGAKGQGKGKGNMIITKEAIYLTTLATEHFISVIGQMAGNVTMSSKKKTLTMEHLKRALSDTDAFTFLEGCFQPSVIIGD